MKKSVMRAVQQTPQVATNEDCVEVRGRMSVLRCGGKLLRRTTAVCKQLQAFVRFLVKVTHYCNAERLAALNAGEERRRGGTMLGHEKKKK